MIREQPSRDPIGADAPVDLTGTTPLGWAAFKLNRKPPNSIDFLFSPGDRSVLPRTPLRIREGSSVKTALYSSNHSTSNEILYGFSEAGGWRPSMEVYLIQLHQLLR